MINLVFGQIITVRPSQKNDGFLNNERNINIP
jgi:hypothetical protein